MTINWIKIETKKKKLLLQLEFFVPLMKRFLCHFGFFLYISPLLFITRQTNKHVPLLQTNFKFKALYHRLTCKIICTPILAVFGWFNVNSSKWRHATAWTSHCRHTKCHMSCVLWCAISKQRICWGKIFIVFFLANYKDRF